MFRVAFFVDDKNLPDVLRSVAGRARELQVVPVVNAEVKAGKIAATTDGDVVSLFMAYAKKHRIKTFTIVDIRAFLKDAGRSITSGSYITRKLRAAGAITQSGKNSNTQYHLRGAK